MLGWLNWLVLGRGLVFAPSGICTFWFGCRRVAIAFAQLAQPLPLLLPLFTTAGGAPVCILAIALACRVACVCLPVCILAIALNFACVCCICLPF